MSHVSALDLTSWSDSHAARGALPVLVRKLIHSTGAMPSVIDFPGLEAVDTAGWDGDLELATGGSWAPAGRSFWELSCRADIALKASQDFKKRTDATPADVRANSTFVFVTARRWPGKKRWAEKAKAGSGWRSVLALDAESLSQWLDIAPAPRLWLEAQLGRPVDHLRSPEDAWKVWADATRPALPFEIFGEALAEGADAIRSYFSQPPLRPLVVAADTRNEAAAFAAGLVSFAAEPLASARAVIVRAPQGLRWLSVAEPLPILIVADPRLEAELSDLPTRTWVILATDRATPDIRPDVEVRPLTWEAFHQTTRKMGLTQAEADELDRQSGRRITIVRRRLSSIPSVRRPLWADMSDLTPILAGLALVGGWFWDKAGDQAILSEICAAAVGDVEAAIRRLSLLEDPPIFAVAGAGGLISRHDAFPALKHVFTRSLLGRYFGACATVLGADDPTLEVEADKRFMASIYGKERPHSGRLRAELTRGLRFLVREAGDVCEGFDAASAAERLARDLFATDDAAWLRLRDVLPDLAEAAPRAFLDAIEASLPGEGDDRGAWQLLKPADSSGFNETPRIKLIWALERLAERPDHYSRVVEIFAQFCARELTDNLVTKPFGSLVGLFDPSYAVDAAATERQARTLRALERRHPSTAWKVALCLVDQRLGGRGRLHRRPESLRPASDTASADTSNSRDIAFEIALGRRLSDDEALDLIEKSPCFDGADLARLWDRVAEWQVGAPETERSKARKVLRRVALWRGRRRAKGYQGEADPRAAEVLELLRGPGPAGHLAWLFESRHVDMGADEVWGPAPDWNERHERIEALRRQALQILWDAGDIPAIVEFAQQVGDAGIVGVIAAATISDLNAVALLDHLDAEQAAWPARSKFLEGFFLGLGRERRPATLEAIASAYRDRQDELLDTLLLCPAESAVWRHVENLADEAREKFWRKATRRAWGDPTDIAYACRAFRDVGRPRAALNQASAGSDGLDSELIAAILWDVSQIAGPPEDGEVDMHAVEDLLEALDARTDVDRNVRLRLDFLYVEALEHTARGAATLSEEMADNPEFFALAIRSYYKRDDGTEETLDRSEGEKGQQMLLQWMAVLDHCRRAPGSRPDGSIDPDHLREWIEASTPLWAEHGRTGRARHKLGELLGRLRIEDDGLWPPLALAEVLEPIACPEFRSGLYFGIMNSRGVHTRGWLAGGQPERALSEKYRRWRDRMSPDYPNLAQACEDVALGYDDYARRHDEDAKFQRAVVR